jgi:hypothetical protein
LEDGERNRASYRLIQPTEVREPVRGHSEWAGEHSSQTDSRIIQLRERTSELGNKAASFARADKNNH